MTPQPARPPSIDARKPVSRKTSIRHLLLCALVMSACGPPPADEPIPLVQISEVRTRDGDAIELHNAGDVAVSLAGWTLVDGNGGEWSIPAGHDLDPDEYVVFWQEHDHPLALGSADHLTLSDDQGGFQDRAVWLRDAATPSLCRLPPDDAFRTCERATLGAANHEDPISPTPEWLVDHVDGSPFQEVNELAFDDLGRLWVGDVGANHLVILDASGLYLATLGEGEFTPPPEGEKGGPEGMQLSAAGDMLVVDRAGRRILVYDPVTLTLVETISTPEAADPTGLVESSAGDLYLADQATGSIHRYGPDRAWLGLVDPDHVVQKIETLALFEEADLILATAEDLSTVELFSLATGKFLDQSIGAPQSTSQPAPGHFRDDIEGIAVDPMTGTIYISDEYNGRIVAHDLRSPDVTLDSRDFATLGAFGTLGSLPGMLDSADGLAIHPEASRLAIADQGNARVQVFSLQTIHTELMR